MSVARPARTLTTGERVLQVLQLVVERQPGLSVKEVAAELGVSLSSAYHLVHTLTAAGYVILEPHCCLRPGPALYRLSDQLLGSRLRPTELEPVASQISAMTGCRSYLAVWSDRDVEVIYVHGRRGVRELPGLRRGFRGAAHALALGKLLLVDRRLEEWPDYLQQERLPRFTPKTIESPYQLQDELREVRASGVAFDREEYALRSACIAVPLVREDGGVAVALGISVPVRRFAAESELLVGLLRRVASAASLSRSDFPVLLADTAKNTRMH